jgi:N-acetyl-1-D-myo-inositol-2-amino-2-deoxy-alpha-D-glucopyranoside deacetylase
VTTGARIATVVRVLLAFVVGVAVGVAGAFLHTSVLLLAGIPWPTGLVLALGLFSVALVHAGRMEGPTGVWACSSGWILAVLVLSWPRPAGDIVIPGTWYGYAFLGLGFLVGLGPLVSAWWRRQGPAPSATVDVRR